MNGISHCAGRSHLKSRSPRRGRGLRAPRRGRSPAWRTSSGRRLTHRRSARLRHRSDAPIRVPTPADTGPRQVVRRRQAGLPPDRNERIQQRDADAGRGRSNDVRVHLAVDEDQGGTAIADRRGKRSHPESGARHARAVVRASRTCSRTGQRGIRALELGITVRLQRLEVETVRRSPARPFRDRRRT